MLPAREGLKTTEVRCAPWCLGYRDLSVAHGGFSGRRCLSALEFRDLRVVSAPVAVKKSTSATWGGLVHRSTAARFEASTAPAVMSHRCASESSIPFSLAVTLDGVRGRRVNRVRREGRGRGEALWDPLRMPVGQFAHARCLPPNMFQDFRRTNDFLALRNAGRRSPVLPALEIGCVRRWSPTRGRSPWGMVSTRSGEARPATRTVRFRAPPIVGEEEPQAPFAP